MESPTDVRIFQRFEVNDRPVVKRADRNKILANGEQCRLRWQNQEPWKRILAQFLSDGTSQKFLSLSTLMELSPVLSGGERDLRGFDFSSGKLRAYRGREVLSADFSYSVAEFGFTIKGTVFRNCRFACSVWWLARFDRCRFEKCVFDESFFYNVNLGAGAEFQDCSFRGISTKGEFFSFGLGARFRRCHFEDVVVQKVVEYGVRFEDCVFSGFFKDCVFYGLKHTRRRKWASIRNLLSGRFRPVEFRRCDLRRLKLENVVFEDGVIFGDSQPPEP